MKDEFGNESPKSKTREQLQDDLRKYGITPRPGYDPKGPNLPDNVDRPSTTREKYLMKEGLRIASQEGEKEKAHAKKLKEERSAKAADTATRNAADSAKTKAAQTSFDFGGPEKDTTSQDKARARKAENEEFKDKRVKASPLTVSSELAKMKEILSKPKGGGGGGGIPSDKMDKMKKMNYKSGGKVSSASKRADGCAIRGKTRA
jgi:hypothetical protein